MIQLEIFPSFHPSCTFQAWKLAGDHRLSFRQPAQYGRAEVRVETPIGPADFDQLMGLARQVIETPTPDGRMILDGVSLKCTLEIDGQTRQQEFRCPQDGTAEWALTDAFFRLSQALIQDTRFVTCIETLEGYFYNKMFVKIFEENPRRIRFYGSLIDYNGLMGLIFRNSNRESLVVDMTNLDGMGTILYECFSPLFQVKDLKFLANGDAQYHLLAMGFDPSQIELFGPSLAESEALEVAEEAKQNRDLEAARIIKRLMRAWFLKYGKRKEADIDGSEQFTLFEKLPSDLKERYINQLDLAPAEWPVYILKINAQDYIINTTHRFIHFANGQFDELDYRNFLGPRGFSAIFVASNEEYEKVSVKRSGHFAEFLLDTKDGQTVAWVVPTGGPGYAFWNITRNCRIIGEKYLRGGSRSSAFFD